MAYLPVPSWSEHLDKVTLLGLPMIGRQLGLFFSGIAFCLGGCYYVIHASTDSRTLLSLTGTVLVLLSIHSILILETSWRAQMMDIGAFDRRWMWEYVAMQPTRATLIALSQGYLAWRYYALSKTSRTHCRVAKFVALMTATEWTLYMIITPMTLWMHFGDLTNDMEERYKVNISRLYCSVCLMANLVDSTLAICFCKRLWSLRGADTELDSSLRYVCYVALGVGLSTAITVLAVAFMFLLGKSDSFRLIAELVPPCYAASFYLSLLSREKIRSTIRTRHTRRVQAAEVHVDNVLDIEKGPSPGAGPFVALERTTTRVEPIDAGNSMAAQLQRTTPKGSDGDEESLTLSQILRDGAPSANEKGQTLLCSSSSASSASAPSSPSPPTGEAGAGVPLARAESASTAASASTAHSPLMGSLRTWVGGDSPSSSPKGSSKGMSLLRREDSRSL